MIGFWCMRSLVQLVVLGFNATLTVKAYHDAHVFPGFLTPVLTRLFFPNPKTAFLTCFCRGERRKCAGKKVCLNRGSNSQPQPLSHTGGAHWFESCPDLIFLPCIYSFVSLLRTLFVRSACQRIILLHGSIGCWTKWVSCHGSTIGCCI